MVALSAIRPVQMREQMNERVVRLYATDMARETQAFPPIVLFYDGHDYWLGDGMHRCAAAAMIARTDILARILPGGEREAVEYAATEAPKDHSKVAYNEGDKQLRVRRMWEMHPEWAVERISNVRIAEACGVSTDTARRARDRYGLSYAPAQDNPATSPIPTPAPPTPDPVASERSAEPPAPSPQSAPATPPAVTVTRTRGDKTTTYQQRQPVRLTHTPAPAPESEPEEPMAVAMAPMRDEDAGDDNLDPFLGRKFGTVIPLMATFHNKVRAALGSDYPDEDMLRAWWETVEPREWQAFREHLAWLRQMANGAHRYILTYHRKENGDWTTPPMVQELAPKPPRHKP